MEGDEIAPDQDFSSKAFTQRREPVHEIIDTFNELYIDSDDEKEVTVTEDLPPPPPLDFNEHSHHMYGVDGNQSRLTSIEEHLANLEHQVSELVNETQVKLMLKSLEDKVFYKLQRETDRLKEWTQSKMDDMGKTVIDCLKRRDKQIEERMRAFQPTVSTPVSDELPRKSVNYQTPVRQVTNSHQSQSTALSQLSVTQYNPPVKLEFPTFDNSDPEDAVTFIERVEEYLDLRPLTSEELLASLSVVLKGTGNDWWRAERANITDWRTFKQKFLFSFLNEDGQEVIAQKLASRKQGPNESVRDFAFNYRAICLRSKPEMTEGEIVKAILRNCNPRLASLLRGTAKTVDDVVRLGTQVEKDWVESKRYWTQVSGENQKKRVTSEKPDLKTHLMMVDRTDNISSLQTSITINHNFINAVIDTGSTYSLIQEKVWKMLKPQAKCLPPSTQTFMLANGHRQKAVGKVRESCEVQGKTFEVQFYVLKD
ncbi:activity-regulated cytoskeleton-associated protein-like, partial [Labeo rohita]|uniref:activity-regulated cytoskeleton-associated protein-like n=1 Tax=Labeo rohita TaxID=84645 RepID=UPI0021E1D3BF